MTQTNQTIKPKYNQYLDKLKHPGITQSLNQALSISAKKYITPERFIKLASLAMYNNPALLQRDFNDLLACMIEIASMGLELDYGGSVGQAYIIPYGEKPTVIIGYKGYIELAYRTDKIKGITADLIRDGDQWEYNHASFQAPKHIYGKERGDIIGAYATALTNKDIQLTTYLDREKLTAIENSSKAKNGPWKDPVWRLDMMKKSAIRQLWKILPKLSDEASLAIEIDNKYTGLVVEPSNSDERVKLLTEKLQNNGNESQQNSTDNVQKQ